MVDAMTLPSFLPPDLALPILGYFALANVLTLMLFALRRAESGDGIWRGNETRALFLSIMGGWLGAKIGRALFRPEEETRGFGLMLNLSILVLPVVVAVPILMQSAPGWVTQGFAAYMAQYSGTADTPADASGTIAAQADSPDAALAADAGAVVQDVEAAAAAPAKDLPKRFGPTATDKRAKSGGHKMVTAQPTAGN